ncbi:HTH-type transcriptional regulator MhqR [Planctomycetes bacterium Poly30]|uniref:HTH-type transcriptional regulator MhqR n=1 Tax=Saltatorellus ferox TaxID=2528018 RepID=A0A518EZQ3_9BACT|nr:HTH-type transcriptional regulator MhqR [Planctomycetes bacterium Poly30]
MGARSKDILARDAYLALLRAHEALQGGAAELFKAHGLTQVQFNVLRILRGAGREGLPCQTIGERLITRVPDMTRILDRMDRDGLVARERSTEDRRVVLVRISDEGLRRVDALDEPVMELHRAQFQGLAKGELESLESALLALVDAART